VLEIKSMGIFKNLFGRNEKEENDYQDKIIDDAINSLHVVSVIQKIDSIGVNNVDQRRSLHDTFSGNTLPDGGTEMGGNYCYPITCSEYADDFNLCFKSQNSNYFIIEIKPYDEKLRTVIFLSDAQSLPKLDDYSELSKVTSESLLEQYNHGIEGNASEFFKEIHMRSRDPNLYHHYETHELLKKCYLKAIDHYIENYSGKIIDKKLEKIMVNGKIIIRKLEKSYPVIKRKEFLNEFSLIEFKALR
jgi:hypothetical protein